MSRAEHAIADAGYDARKAMGRYLGEVGASLHFGLLHTIYQQFPDLRPPPNELPTIDSELCWDEVTLPASVSERDLDKMIFVLLKPHWRKTAMILVLAHEHCAQQGWPIEPEVVAARIQALADDDLIDHQGDLRMWRFSEVRLKP
jgi:hypothetical protein